MPKIELERLLSKLSIASRKDAAILILKGLVKVNGRICKIPLEYVDTRSKIEVQNEIIKKVDFHYLILNKPKGLIVTRQDEMNRSTAYECISDWQGPLLQAVGRLDQASEGLLIFTNDHKWANDILGPKSHIKKVYHVHVTPIPTPEILELLSAGILLEGTKTLPSKFELLRLGEKNCWISVELNEGRNRQIRKMLETKGIEVLRLIRVQLGEIHLNDLAKGKWREFTEEELRAVKGSHPKKITQN